MSDTNAPWERARRPEQKEERRVAILEAAGQLLDREGLEATGLSAIAREAGISKANIYRYFESREAILMQLLLEEIDDWAKELIPVLDAHANSGDVDTVADLVARSVIPRHRYCVLVGGLAAVFERNVAVETIAAFKTTLLEQLAPLYGSLIGALPTLTVDGANLYVTTLFFSAAGSWPFCDPAPAVREVIARPGFELLRFDFTTIVTAQSRALLREVVEARR